MRIQLLHAGEILHTLDISTVPITVGRSGANTLVLAAQDVSGHHAVLYRDSHGHWLKDLGSSNGTFHNGVAVREPVALAEGDRVRFASSVEARVVAGEEPLAEPVLLVRCDSAVAVPIRGTAVAVPTATGFEVVNSDLRWWLARDGELGLELLLDTPFEVDGVQYRLERVATEDAATVRPDTRHPYALTVDLPGSVCWLRRVGQPEECVFNTDNRVALLYALAQRWLDDGPGSGRGWMSDGDLATAVWGRAWKEQGSNNLHVLVHRVRSEAEAAGFDRWFIEKRRGRTRISVQEATLL